MVQDNCQFINAYAYCIVKGNVKNIVASLYEMKVLMGPDYDLVLMERGVDKIRVDLEIAINELTYSQSKIV